MVVDSRDTWWQEGMMGNLFNSSSLGGTSVLKRYEREFDQGLRVFGLLADLKNKFFINITATFPRYTLTNELLSLQGSPVGDYYSVDS